MTRQSRSPRTIEVKWLGGRTWIVTDLRELPGPMAFHVEYADGSWPPYRINRGDPLEHEIADLIDGEGPGRD